MKTRISPYILEAGICFGVIGLFFGLALTRFAVETLLLTATVNGFLSPATACVVGGSFLWWLVVIRKKQATVGRGIVAGVAVGLLALPLSFYMAKLFHFVLGTDLPWSRTGQIHQITADDILYSFWNLFSIGWLAATICGVIGGMLVQRQSRLLEAEETSMSAYPVKVPQKEWVQAEEGSEAQFSGDAILPVSLLCPFCSWCTFRIACRAHHTRARHVLLEAR